MFAGAKDCRVKTDKKKEKWRATLGPYLWGLCGGRASGEESCVYGLSYALGGAF